MPADSSIVKSTTKILSESSSVSYGKIDVLVDWWWVIFFLIIIVYIFYLYKKRIIVFYRKIYIISLVKMSKMEIIYCSWNTLYNEGNYEQLIKECIELENRNDISDEVKNKIRDYREKAESAKKYNDIDELINKTEEYIKSALLYEAKDYLVKAREQLDTYVAKGKTILKDRIDNLENRLKTVRLEIFSKRIKEAIDKNDYDFLITAFSVENLTKEGLSKKEVSPVTRMVKEKWTETTKIRIDANEIDKAVEIVKVILKFEVFKDDEFVGELKANIINKIRELITDKINAYLYEDAKSIRDHYKDILPNSTLREINKSIELCENSKPAKINESLNKALEYAKKKLFIDAWREYEKAKKLKGEEFTETKEQILTLETEERTYQNQIKFENFCAKIKEEIRDGNDTKALDYLEMAKSVEVDDKSILDKLAIDIKNLQTTIANENKFFGAQPIVSAKYDGREFFNVPKKENHGEDADPYVNVSANRNWGIIAVFDGMGGAGARRYKYANTGEEHTSSTPELIKAINMEEEHASAWWASRYVREAVEELMSSRPKGENPIIYLENNLKAAIVNKLNTVIRNFPAAKAPMLSKMMRKLPTTMALCAYTIDEKNIKINCYWSGDSRIYMFDKNKMYFLTKDDANAANGDPFSPANMDLAMNNTICQDRDFVINKSTILIPIIPNNPIVLIAATDGCFGYFKNPIEFEHTIRHALDASKQFDDWMPLIRKAIIDNIQQDDFSMALIEIGETDFDSTKEQLTISLNNDLFKRYYDWKNSYRNEQDTLATKIAQIDENIIKSKEDASKAKAAIGVIEADIAKFEELFSKYNDDEYLKFKGYLLEKKNSENIIVANINETINEYSRQRTLLKEQLEKSQLSTESENNVWYTEYKELFEIVDPLGIL